MFRTFKSFFKEKLAFTGLYAAFIAVGRNVTNCYFNLKLQSILNHQSNYGTLEEICLCLTPNVGFAQKVINIYLKSLIWNLYKLIEEMSSLCKENKDLANDTCESFNGKQVLQERTFNSHTQPFVTQIQDLMYVLTRKKSELR